MRPDHAHVRELVADAWQRWAARCAELTDEQWAAPTRCRPWDVAALVAHACPQPSMFDELAAAVIDAPAEVDDAADVLRTFNRPDGIAHTTADALAESALSEARQLSPESAARRFTECAAIIRASETPAETVLRYPEVGSTTVAAITELALMEATVHLLDLADAVGGARPSRGALAATRDPLIAVPDATVAVEVLAGRLAPEHAVPAIR